MSDVITTASHQWATRPADERFESLLALAAFKRHQKENSREVVVSSRKLHAEPIAGDELAGLQITGPNGHAYAPTHHSFGQLCQLGGGPAGYLRTLPAPMAADCINYGLGFKRDVQDVGILLRGEQNELGRQLGAATGPNYGRVWDADISDMLVAKFGDGRSGQWRVPGEFGKAVEVTKANTTLYASDRDMFVFLADEERRIEVPNRRDGKPGSLARGFFVWNSEVGSRTIGAAFFLFDYVCQNRMIWGSRDYQEVRIRHTSGAPDRWLESIVPVLEDYSQASSAPVVEAIATAQQRRVDDRLDAFLAERFGKGLVADIKKAHEVDEHRPIETVWDVTVAATAYARSIPMQDLRVEIETKAGALLTV